jgi:hypothetical protein
MPHAQLTEAVRRRVAQVFADLGVPGSDALRESLLICSGAYCGRRFDAAAGHAIWFVEEDQIKFYGADGKLAEVAGIAATAAPAPQRLAA